MPPGITNCPPASTTSPRAGAVELVADCDDLAVRAQDVGPVGLIGRDDGAALDEYRHVDYLCVCATGALVAWVATEGRDSGFLHAPRLQIIVIPPRNEPVNHP